jgi:Helicase conserved C-terminal domain
MTVFPDSSSWKNYLERTLQCYDEPLLRSTASRLLKPRSQWPAHDLIERWVDALANPAMVDRRLAAQDAPGRRLLALMGHGRQQRWRFGSLLEMLATLGHADGPAPVLALFEAGLLFPDLLGRSASKAASSAVPSSRLRNFEQWLAEGAATGYTVFTAPTVLARAVGEDLGIPECAAVDVGPNPTQKADGLEWPLRLAVVWQQLKAGPLRRTQQGDFFKRDLDRLRSDAILNAPPSDSLADLPDPALLAIALAQTQGMAVAVENELHAGDIPALWEEGLPATIASLWSGLELLDSWNPQSGWTGAPVAGSPFPSAYLLSLLFLARQPVEAWISPADVETWILEHHPFWLQEDLRPSQQRGWLPAFLLGLCFQLGLLEAARDQTGQWAVRLTTLGRNFLRMTSEQEKFSSYQQTLLVQPNLEIILYRQGASPDLIGKLSRFAAWKSLGAAGTLQLQAEQVYRALESGLSFEAILRILEQYGMRSLPSAVIESLRTWADKRERITVYPAATLFEFATAQDLNEALARGLPAVRLSDRLLAVASESNVDFSNFRLTGTRDYGLPPEKCVDMEEDGVTLAVDQSRSDLLLETEIQRLAETLDSAGVSGKRRYRLTSQSLTAARENGLDVPSLEEWFLRRCGEPLSPAARLLMTAGRSDPAVLQSRLVLQVASEELADGLMQWPATRSLIQDRLGPVALVIAAEDFDTLRQRLDGIGLNLELRV